ncbi:MAG: carboxypeptidase-like regulatory domain-containing protein, partial [Bacillota bacterium]|nr:carboxypeptidase-like regulatory domain-containing protein [Bacillota bacterium]
MRIKNLKKKVFCFLVFCILTISFDISFAMASQEQPNLKATDGKEVTTQSMDNSTSLPTITTEVYSDDYGDTINTAYEIGLQDEIKGTINYDGDCDFFSLKPTIDGVYHVMKFSPASKNSDQPSPFLKDVINIYDSNGKVLTYDYNMYKDATRADINLKKDNIYYFSISSSKTCSNYDYSFKILGPHLDDIGDTIEFAKVIQYGDKIEGSADYCYDLDYRWDVDCFVFTPPATGAYLLKNFKTVREALNYSEPNLKDIISIMDNLKKSVDLNSDDNQNFYVQLSGGRPYYIAISSQNSNMTRFKYSLEIEGPVEDDYSNELKYATEIKLDSKVEGKGNYSYDTDLFKFKVMKEGSYFIDDYIRTGSTDNYLVNSISVLDEDGTYVGKFENSNKTSFILEKDKYYYLGITNRGNTDYSFSVKGPVEDDCGNTKETAKEIEFNNPTEIIGNYFGDVDCISFSPTVSGLYNIADLTQPENTYSYFIHDLSIYDSDDKCIDKVEVSSKVYFKLNKDKKYYMYNTFKDYSNDTKKFLFSVNGPDIDDFGDTKETAKSISVGEKIEGVSDYMSDCDYFSFIPESDGLYSIDNFSINNTYVSDIERRINVFDANGNYVYLKENYYQNKAYLDLKKGCLYYLSISSYDKYTRLSYSFNLAGPILDDYGNSKENASEIQLDKEIKGECNYFYDDDFFKFKPSESGLYCLDNYNAYRPANPGYLLGFDGYLKLTDSNNDYINIFAGATKSKCYFRLVKDTTYYFSFGDAFFSNPINYSFVLKGPIGDDFDNTPSFSKTLELGKSTSGNIDYYGDVDAFDFTTGAEGIYYISVPELKSEYIRVYDKSNNLVELYKAGVVDPKPYYLRANETYYINVTAPIDSIGYNIKVSGPVSDDYGNSTKNGTVLKINNPLKGNINYSGDSDVFKIIPTREGIIYFKFDADFNYGITFHQGNDGYCVYKNLGNNIISAWLGVNDVYSIEIYNKDNASTGNYTITASDKLDDLIKENYKISGYIKPDFLNNASSGTTRAGFIVKIKDTGLSAVTDENGYFEIPDVIKSSTGYDIEITKGGYLKRVIKGIVVNGNVSISNAEAPVDIWAGDMIYTRDDVINMADILQIVKAFNTRNGAYGF